VHCRCHRHHFPDEHWWNFWECLLAGGDLDGAARLMVEALYVAVRVASFERVLAFLQQRFRVPPRRSTRPDPVIPQHLLASYDRLLPGAPLSSSSS
jgi:hypothetical protein